LDTASRSNEQRVPFVQPIVNLAAPPSSPVGDRVIGVDEAIRTLAARTTGAGARAVGIRRVMFVLQSTAIGGMESHCVDLAAELARRGHAVFAVVPNGETFDPLADRFAASRSTVRQLNTDDRSGRIPQIRELLRFSRLLAAVRPDVVHLHLGGATGGTAVVALARLFGAVAVVTEHDVPAEHPGPLAKASRFVLDRLAHVLIAVSRRNAGIRLGRIAPRAKTFAVVLNGVPLPDLDEGLQLANRASVRDEYGIPYERVLLGSVVRLAEGKGLRELLPAIAKLRHTGDDADLMLVGDGPLRSELEDLSASLGIANIVHFVGNQREPGRFVDAFDAFVLPVPVGSMSIALLEAMARGVAPLITFCGPEEAVCHAETGLCGPPNDPAGLAEALRPLVRDRELSDRLGRAAASHVRTHYSVSRVAGDVLDLYAAGRSGLLPADLLATAPVDPRPGDRSRREAASNVQRQG
jgi:glycosyltransferase involved in cell wall biosynthesis